MSASASRPQPTTTSDLFDWSPPHEDVDGAEENALDTASFLPVGKQASTETLAGGASVLIDDERPDDNLFAEAPDSQARTPPPPSSLLKRRRQAKHKRKRGEAITRGTDVRQRAWSAQLK